MNPPTANPDDLLVTDKLTKRFGGLVAVDALNLNVKRNHIHSIIGPNGAGKTTVFNCIMEFYQPDGGQVWFDGERIDGLTPGQGGVRRHQPHLPEHPPVQEHHGGRKHPGRHAHPPQVELVGRGPAAEVDQG